MNFALLFQFTRQDLLDRYAGSVLGGIWTFIQPLINMLVFILVFSQIMASRLPAAAGGYSYSIYLISALLGWIAFQSTLIRTSTLFLDKASIITRVRVSLWSLPLAVVLGDTFVYLVSMVFFLTYLVLVDHEITANLVWVPFVFAIQQSFAYALGMILACLSVFLRDVKESVNLVLQLWFWLTPIVYVLAIIPEPLQPWFRLNPMFPVIDAYHATILFGTAPALPGLILVGALSLALLAIGRWLLARLERDIRDLV